MAQAIDGGEIRLFCWSPTLETGLEVHRGHCVWDAILTGYNFYVSVQNSAGDQGSGREGAAV